MDVSTVCSSHAAALTASDAPTASACFSFMKQHFVNLARSGHTRQLTRETLAALASSDDLRSDEGTLLEACADWARHRLAAAGGGGPTPPGDAKVRAELGELLYRVRLPLLGLEEFSRVVGASGLVSGDEKTEVLGYIMSRGGRKGLKFDSGVRWAARDLPQCTEAVVNRFRGTPTPPSNDDKENFPSHPKSPRTSLSKSPSAPQKSPTASHPPPKSPSSHANLSPQFRGCDFQRSFPTTPGSPPEPNFRVDALDFQTTRDIHITALGLYAGDPSPTNNSKAPKLRAGSSSNHVADAKGGIEDGATSPDVSSATVSAHSVVIEIQEGGNPVTGRLTRQHKAYSLAAEGRGGDQPLRVALREPILVHAGTRHTVVVKATGPPTYRGTEGVEEVAVAVPTEGGAVAAGGGAQVGFRFFKSAKDFNGTDVGVGQIAQIFFSV